MRAIALAVGLILAAGVAGEASAQEAAYRASFDPEQFAASVDPEQIGFVDGARTQPWGTVAAGLTFHFAGPSLQICVNEEEGDCRELGDILDSRLRADLGVLVGLGRFDVRLRLPLVLHQSTDFSPPAGEPGLAEFGLGDVKLSGRVQIARPGPIALAADLGLSIPTGGGNFMSDSGLMVDPRLLADVRVGRVAFGVGAGYRYRQRAAHLADLYIDGEVTWSAAGEVSLVPGKLALGAAAFGRLGLADAPADPMGQTGGAAGAEERPIEALASLRYAITSQLSVDVGGGAAVTTGYGAVPFRVIAGVRWSTPRSGVVSRGGRIEVRIADRDDDGVVDEGDQCPKAAEDQDGFEDADGCPDPDNDGDGFADAKDECPLAFEDRDRFEDDDGCPEADNDEDGVADAEDVCPVVAEDQDGYQDADGCPEEDKARDRDADGLADLDDLCPLVPEDKNGVADEDGCPEEAALALRDRDKDGLADGVDQCPLAAEDKDGVKDDDGCPEAEGPRVAVKPVEPATTGGGDDRAPAGGGDDRAPAGGGDDGAPAGGSGKIDYSDDDMDSDTDADADADADTSAPPGGDRTASTPVARDRDGDGIPDSRDKCKRKTEDLDGVQDEDGCPETDADKDRVPDVVDRCPLQAEDKDKVADDDGCPEDDADGDGLKDKADKCPLQAEVYNDNGDDDGCPDAGRTMAVVSGDAVIIDEKVFFDLDRARVKTRAKPVLNAVANILAAHSELIIRIEGHADDRGDAEWNLKLSQMRAERVREYLISRGVPASRLELQAFGAQRPLVSGSSTAARDKNRRVEFVISGRTTDAP